MASILADQKWPKPQKPKMDEISTDPKHNKSKVGRISATKN